MQAQVAKELAENHIVRKCLSSSFYRYPKEIQDYLYGQVPPLEDGSKIPMDAFISISKMKDEISPYSLEGKIYEIADGYIASQNKDGSWGTISIEEAEKHNPDDKNELEAYSKEKKKSGTTKVKFANAWSVSLVSLFLMKLKRYILLRELNAQYDIKKLDSAITDAMGWLEKECILPDGTFGCSSHVSVLNKKEFNFYDSSLALITLIYEPEMVSARGNRVRSFFKDLVKRANLDNSDIEVDLSNTGALAYFITATIKCLEQKIDEVNQSEVDKMLNELVSRQNVLDGGWPEFKDGESMFDQTCYALSAISKYQKHYITGKYQSIVDHGIDFLYKLIVKEGPFPPVYCWGGIPENKIPCLKNSSLAISTLLRCGVPYDDPQIKLSLESIYTYQKNTKCSRIERSYFNCMLIDYLRSSEGTL